MTTKPIAQAFSFETGHFWPAWYFQMRRPAVAVERNYFDSLQLLLL